MLLVSDAYPVFSQIAVFTQLLTELFLPAGTELLPEGRDFIICAVIEEGFLYSYNRKGIQFFQGIVQITSAEIVI